MRVYYIIVDVVGDFMITRILADCLGCCFRVANRLSGNYPENGVLFRLAPRTSLEAWSTLSTPYRNPLRGLANMNSPSIDQSEHRYFSVVAIAVTVTVLAGFIPLYTLRLLRHDPNLTLLVHAHGFVMTAWIALFLTQTLLIARRRVDLHRRLGTFGVGLAMLVILVGAP